MSAYICNPEHIGLLAAVATEVVGIDRHPSELAEEFARENIASVAYRYPSDTGNGDRPGPCLTDDQIVRASALYAEYFADNIPYLSAKDVLSMVRCLIYQSCEHPGWESSVARSIVTEIETWARDLYLTIDKRPATVEWDYYLPEEMMLPSVRVMYEGETT